MKFASSSVCSILVLAAASIATPAGAQSSVVLYGRVVGGVDYVDKIADAAGATHSAVRAADNQWGTSLLGFKGTEDLGDGLHAEFDLESGFGLKSGNVNGGTAFFNRRSYVGLSSAQWGTLHFGKNLLISNDVYNLDPTGQQFIGTATLVRGRNWPGAVNVIEYTTPTWAGFSAGVQVGLGEQPGSTAKLRTEGVSATYDVGKLELRAIYSAVHDANGGFSDVYNYSRDSIFGGTYPFGPAKVFAGYEMISAGDAPATAPSRLRHGWLGARYDVSPALTLIGAGFRVSSNRVDGSANLLMVGADYHLSKRTVLYASLGGVSNSSTANYSAEIYAGNPAVGGSQRSVYTGIAHSF